MRLAAGAVLLLLGLLGLLVRVHLRGRRFFDRPSAARHRMFDPLLHLLAWSVLAAGVAALWSASPPVAAGAALVLLAFWGYRRLVRSVAFQRRLLRRDFESLKRARPGVPEREILSQLAYRRNPRWGEELIQQMVIDYPDFEDLSRIIVMMERGFRGFR